MSGAVAAYCPRCGGWVMVNMDAGRATESIDKYRAKGYRLQFGGECEIHEAFLAAGACKCDRRRKWLQRELDKLG